MNAQPRGERRTLGVTAFQSCEGPFGSRLIFVTLEVKLATTRHLNDFGLWTDEARRWLLIEGWPKRRASCCRGADMQLFETAPKPNICQITRDLAGSIGDLSGQSFATYAVPAYS